jgi:16S rRNA G966 N2-methylase RsmD
VRAFLQVGAGLGPLVEDALTADFGGFEATYRDESGMTVDVPASRSQLASLQYVKNAFAVLAEVPRTSLQADIDALTRRLRTSSNLMPKEAHGRAFRLMFSIDGELVGVPAPSRQRLVSVIEARTRGAFNARGGGSGTEFWLIGRRDLDTLLFCERLSTGRAARAARGALATDLSTLLVLASRPRPEDVFLDPFGGSGAIVAARAAWPARSLTDSDLRARQHAPQFSSSGRAPRVRVLAEDARTLPSVPDDSIDVIVTDPPWGEYEELDQPYPEFAAAVLACFRRVLKDGARVVLLLSRRSADLVDDLLPPHSLVMQRRLDVLVNGHPSTVLVARHRR